MPTIDAKCQFFAYEERDRYNPGTYLILGIRGASLEARTKIKHEELDKITEGSFIKCRGILYKRSGIRALTIQDVKPCKACRPFIVALDYGIIDRDYEDSEGRRRLVFEVNGDQFSTAPDLDISSFDVNDQREFKLEIMPTSFTRKTESGRVIDDLYWSVIKAEPVQ